MTLRFRDDLIIDVGMHVGQDTAYYLHRGFSVVAIEANPELVAAANQRFRAEIASGRLTIREVGIAAQRGTAEFYLSRKKSVWSSFDRANAGKQGGAVDVVTVNCVPFIDVLEEFGVPHYLKVDIEGSDRLCVDALDASCLPDFVSVEMAHDGGDDDIVRLAELGFTRFACVRQNDLSVLHPDDLDAYLGARQRAARMGQLGNILRAAKNTVGRVRRPRDGSWPFPRGSSGAFGAALNATWHDADAARQIRGALYEADTTLSGAGLGDWFDIHAAR